MENKPKGSKSAGGISQKSRKGTMTISTRLVVLRVVRSYKI